MTSETISEKPAAEQAAAPPVRKGRGVLYFVVALLLLLLLTPVVLVAAGVTFLYLRPAAPLPPAQIVSVPQEFGAVEGEPASETIGVKRTDEHPLDPALKVAYQDLDQIRKHVYDYTATLVSRERIKGVVGPEQTVFVKIRNPKLAGDKPGDMPAVPFSVYLKFIGPKDRAGREVIYVAGQNDNMLIGHEAGFLNVTRYKLYTDGWVAKQGERYPITEIGVERLTEQLITRGEEERVLDPRETHVEVAVEKGIECQGRTCTRIRLNYPEKTAHVEFHSAEICIDEELAVPIYYVAHSWPAAPGGEPLLEEEYSYRDIKLNVGLTDADFDPDNKEYNFPKVLFDASRQGK